MAFGTSISNALFGKPQSVQQLSTVTPGQSAALNDILKTSLGGIKNIQNQPNNFQAIANKTISDYGQHTLPNLLERLTAGGGYNSSALQAALSQGDNALKESLAALGANYDMQRRGQDIGLYSNLLSQGLRPQFENIISPATGGLFGGAAGGLASSLPLFALLRNLGASSTGSSTFSGTPASSDNASELIPLLLRLLRGN